MIIFNNLTKNNTCDSIEVIAHEKYVLTIEYKDHELVVTEHKMGKTLKMHMIGIVDNGIEYDFQAYNNKIRIIKDSGKPYRGPQ